VDVTVTTPVTTSATSAADAFTYAPTVLNLNPNTGPETGGTPVTITGTGFDNASSVLFGTIAATDVVISTDGTQITATSPAGAGVVDVTVTTPAGTSPLNPLADQFTYMTVVAPIAPVNLRFLAAARYLVAR
jgi:hypothetical protein